MLLDQLPFPLEKGKQLEEAFQRFDECDTLLLRSPPGSGKTAISLSYLLTNADEKRSVIFFRTKAQIDQGLTLLGEMVKELDDAPLIVPLVGKMEACLHPPADPRKLRWWCQLSNCERSSDRWGPDLIEELVRMDDPFSIDRFLAWLKEKGLCPFYTLRKLAKQSDILLTTYPFFTSEELYQYVGDRDILILDEAHSLLMLVSAEMERQNFEKGKELLKEAEEVKMSPNQYAMHLWKGYEKERAIVLSDFLQFQSAEGQCYRTNQHVLKIMPPKKLLNKRISGNEKILVMSSTLYPSTLYKKVFGIQQMTLIEGMLKSSTKRFICGLTCGLTSQYEKRSETMFRKYGKVITLFTHYLHVPTLIFTPSYSFASSLGKQLDLSITKNLGEVPKHLEREGKVLTVARGALSEGIDIDFRGEEPRLLLITGLPYPKTSLRLKAIAKEYSKTYDMSTETFLEAFNRSSMISALTQMIGRTGRTKKGVAVVIDDRIKHYNFKFPLFTRPSSLIKHIKEFDLEERKK